MLIIEECTLTNNNDIDKHKNKQLYNKNNIENIKQSVASIILVWYTLDSQQHKTQKEVSTWLEITTNLEVGLKKF